MSMFDKHIFALYTEQDLSSDSNTSFEISDEKIYQRLTKILRLSPFDEVIIFNKKRKITLILKQDPFVKKNKISGLIKENQLIEPNKPEITLLQAITKKNDFEEILYSAGQLGVHKIIPIRTKKSHNLSFDKKDQDRFLKILIAACEQAKQFILPIIEKPITIQDALTIPSDIKIIFDSTGNCYENILPKLKNAQKISVLFGPEGGLTTEEIVAATKENFFTTKLTPTILRSKEAPLLGIGIIRAIIF